jgi:predicted transcriptional regulator
MVENRLGSLERAVLSFVWERGDTSVRDACERLGSSVAYTTVMTTMDRLFKKGLLTRRKVGRAFVYTATATREELEGAVAAELVQSLLQNDGTQPLPILSSLVDAVSDRDRALLGELERLIREKRRAIERKGKDR